MLNHAIEHFEMLSGVSQQLRVRGVIRALDRDDHGADSRMLSAYECDEFVLRLGRSNNKNFPHASKRFRNIIKKLDVIGCFVAAVRTFANMGMFVLIMCFHD